jgi:hypothetical protein
MKLTPFTFYKNTPLVNMQNTIHFTSNEERDEFFKTKYTNLKFNSVFNFRRDRGIVQIDYPIGQMNGYNYCSFIDGFDGVTYYAYIVSIIYLNDNCTRIDLLIDPIMTFTQGNILETIGYVDVIRSHLPKYQYKLNLDKIRNSQDMPTVTTLQNTRTISETFGSSWVMVYSSAQLTADFGTEKEPKLVASSGATFDKISSPVDVYLVNRTDFYSFSSRMAQYPWIAQNITKCIIIPKKFIPETILDKVKMKDGFDKLYQLKNKALSPAIESTIKYSFDELCDLFQLDREQEAHLLRSGYCGLELTDFKSQTLPVETSKLHSFNLKCKNVLGYFNNIKYYIDGYGARGINGERAGFYLNYSLTFDEFDELPTMINSGNLSKALTAYSRELSNSRTFSGRLRKIQGSDNLQDRVFNSLTAFSDVFSGGLASAPSKIAGLFNNEYEYYRDQDAQLKELSLQPPKVSNQTNGNSLLIKTDEWGLHLQVFTLSSADRNRVSQYYNMFGYDINERKTLTGLIDSQERCNWLQFKGVWNLPDIDVDFLNQLRTIFEGGVRFWHNDGRSNPFSNALYDNRMVK